MLIKPIKSISKTNKRNFIFWVIILIPYLAVIPAAIWYYHKLNNIENSSFIIISKDDMFLYHYNYKGELLQKSKVATGKNFGTKKTIGDLKTPEGVFHIGYIEDASSWAHDFKDDTLGAIAGAYGPYFIRLDVPGQKGIGIHGTHDNNSLGTRASEGCIRMNNIDLIKLVNSINTASIVIVTPSAEDLTTNTIMSIKSPNNIRQSKEIPQDKLLFKKKILKSDTKSKKK